MKPTRLKLVDRLHPREWLCELDGVTVENVVSYKIEGKCGELALFTVTV